MDVEVPECLKKPLIIPNKLMMGPGPSNCSPRVLHSLGYPTLGHLHKETLEIMNDVKEGIQYIFQTKNQLTLCVSGTGHAGMEAALVNMLEPGSKALCANAGFWGLRAADMVTRCGAIPITIDVPPGTSFSFAQLEMALQKHKPDVLYIAHCESSTGVLQKLDGLGDICHRYNCILVVDSVASFGGTPLFMDKWKIDVLYTGSQKVLGVPPGITPISFSSRAQSRLFSRKTPVSSYYLDMKLLGQYWGCYEGKPPIYHHTISANLLYSLREGLAQVCEETLEKLWERHQKCSNQLYTGLQNLGLQMYVAKKEDRSSTVIAICVPNGVDWKSIISFAMEKDCLEVAGGLGQTAGKIFRLGLMGYNCTTYNVERALEVFKESLKHSHIMVMNSKL